ncbi:unnamed protein product, partial [marine sediment metagenome]
QRLSTIRNADIVMILKNGNIVDFVNLPDRYDTAVGEKGLNLSGGQKQRIAIARAVLMDPKILILDDATSSVDTETEHLIQKALLKLMKNKTSIIIAQRLSTIRNADIVMILKNGNIVDFVTRKKDKSCHDILLETSKIYTEIFNNQLIKEDI